MEFVQHHGPHALERRIREQPPGQHSFRDKTHSGTCADRLFKPHLVTNRLANLFAHLPGHPPRRQAGSNPARFQHNDLTADDIQQCRRHTGRLTRARGCFNHKIRRALERRDHLRQNRVHRKYKFAYHQFSSKHAPPQASTPPPESNGFPIPVIPIPSSEMEAPPYPLSSRLSRPAVEPERSGGGSAVYFRSQ